MPLVICRYLLDLFFEIGPTSMGGMGPIQLQEETIKAWQFNQHVRLLPWECSLLRRLSSLWIAEAARAADPAAPPPYTPPAPARHATDSLREWSRKLAAS